VERQIKVKLQTDLTKYAPGLVPGVEGHTIGQHGLWSRGSDRFIGVCFPGIAKLDVLWESIEIIDKEYLEEAALLNKKQMEELKSAQNVVKHVGPKGGFRHLSYEYTSMELINNNVTNGSKSEAERIIKIFEKYGIKVEIRIER
jgi:hypothetical protein